MMLHLLLHLGNECYALDVRRIVEVVPLVHCRPLAHTPPCVAGTFDYRGTLVPVIDLCRLTGASPCRALYTTRIVLVDYPAADGRSHILGLLAEQITETVKLDPTTFEDAGVCARAAPYLGGLARQDSTLIQRIDTARLLPDDLQRLLFAECT